MSSSWLSHHHGHPHSAVHRLPVALKLAIAGGIVLTTVLAPISWWRWFVGVSVLLGISVVVSRIPLRFLLKRLLLLSPFIVGVAVAQAVHSETRSRWEVVALKSGLCLVTILIVSNTTPLSRMLQVLRQVRVPALLITTIALMHRYLFVLAGRS